MRRFALVLALPLATGIAAAGADHPQTASKAPSYSNPVLPGDYPDPSVIRVGRDYWATATTSQWAPIFPLLHSTDLVNWELRGAVFQTPPSWSAGSYWAPEISADGGRFFVYYTARKKEGPPSTLLGGAVSQSNGPLCVAVADAARPEGPYTDRGALVCQEAGSIDAVAVRDENGRRYLVWKEDGNSRKLPTPLWAQPLSDDGVRLVGEKTEILRNEAPWEAHLIEGPYILRRGDWFYMFYSADACCGRRCNYKLGVARSRRLLGPWERFPGNPILAGNEQWKCPGHGTIVQDQAGRTFLLYHAYEASTFEFVGRQALLDEVTWNADGWPAINSGKGPSGSAPSPSTVTQRRASTLLEDDFNEAAIDPGWQWPWDQTSAPSIEAGRGGWLRLATGTASMAIAARPTRGASYAATTVVDVASIAPGARPGLAAFGNRDNALALTAERVEEPAGALLTIVVWQTQKGERRTLATTQVPLTPFLHLRLSAKDRTRFEFAVSPDGQAWKTVGGAQGEYLPPWDLAVRVALLVSGRPASSARFGSFRLESR
ncbi:MAG TPA: family 43 glycosylhydrolase [Vicinamibacterales bacterium]|nr:family 43 glycosylhydrolase [Vicinamibacterales bacterium]